MSPRSQHSASDKSRKSASPRHSQSLLPNAIPETGAPSTLAAEMASPQQANSDRHAAKVARMEASASQGYGGGIPEKIEEGVEPT
jgi:small neutral amino acid transporter SnatA (MarC family)